MAVFSKILGTALLAPLSVEAWDTQVIMKNTNNSSDQKSKFGEKVSLGQIQQAEAKPNQQMLGSGSSINSNVNELEETNVNDNANQQLIPTNNNRGGGGDVGKTNKYQKPLVASLVSLGLSGCLTCFYWYLRSRDPKESEYMHSQREPTYVRNRGGFLNFCSDALSCQDPSKATVGCIPCGPLLVYWFIFSLLFSCGLCYKFYKLSRNTSD